MSGLLNSLNVGVSGLKTSQNALNTTAHNLANVDTKGYTRQQVIIQDNFYRTHSVNVSTNQVGSGTSVQLVRTVREQFLDKKYRLEVGRQGFYDVQYSAVSEIETVLGELEGEKFQTSLEDLWTAFSELSNDSTDLTNRQTVINVSQVFLERAQQINKQISDYQKNLNLKITDTVNQVNAIGKEIAKLNEAIRRYEAGGIQNANDLRDTRNLLIDQLSQLVSVSYAERPDGTVNVNVEGVNFVTADDCIEMGVTTVTPDSELLKPVWPSIDQDVYTNPSAYADFKDQDVGVLKGILVARGDFAADYTSIPKAPIEPKRDAFKTDAEYDAAYAQYKTDLNQYEKDVKEYNSQIDSSAILSFQAQFDQLVHGIVTAINDTLSPNKEVTRVNADGTTEKIKILDTDKAAIGAGNGNDVQGTEMFERVGTKRYETMTITYVDTDGTTKTESVQVYVEEDPSDKASLYSIDQIRINENLVNNPNLLPLNDKDGTGAFDKETLEKLLDIWNEPFTNLDPNSLTPYTFKEYYSAMVDGVGTKGNTINGIATSQAKMVHTVDTARVSVTGVSGDEELSNMVRFQHAYNASSRYINTVNSMLDTIINSFFS